MEDAFAEKQVTRFRELHHFLKANLKELTVYKSGEVQKEINISRFAPSGECVVLYTVSIET